VPSTVVKRNLICITHHHDTNSKEHARILHSDPSEEEASASFLLSGCGSSGWGRQDFLGGFLGGCRQSAGFLRCRRSGLLRDYRNG